MRQRLIARLGDAAGERRQFVGREAHRAADGLAMAEQIAVGAGLQFVGVLRRDFDEIAEHAIVLDAQLRHAAFAAIARFQLRDDAARFVAQAAHFVERRMRAGGDEAAVAREKGRLGDQEMRKPVGQLEQAAMPSARSAARCASFARRRAKRIVRRQAVAQAARGLQARRAKRQIARAAAPHRQPRQRARDVGRARADPRADAAAQFGIAGKKRHRILARERSSAARSAATPGARPVRARPPPSPCGRWRQAGCRRAAPDSVSVSSRLRRVAASIAMKARSPVSRQRLAETGSFPFWVSSR